MRRGSLEAGDWVVHAMHGVGRIVEIEARTFGPEPEKLYYRVSIHAGVLWVPVEGVPSGLRRLTAKRELAGLRAVLRSRPSPLARDHRQLRTDLQQRLQDSSLEARCEVVRDLTAMGWRRPLSETSLAMLRSTRDQLLAEWAAAQGLSPSGAAHEVDALLLEGRMAYDTSGSPAPGR